MSRLDAPDREHPSVFLSDSLSLAAYLASIGHTPNLVDTGTSKILFSFERTPEVLSEVSTFRNGHARIDPSAYDTAKRALRRQMDELLGGGR